QGAEEEQREQEDEWEREQLRFGEVVTYLRVGLRARDRRAAKLHISLRGEPTLEALGIGFEPRIRPRLEVGDDVRRAGVTRDDGRVVAVVVAARAVYGSARAELCLHLAHAARGACRLNTAAVYERDHAWVDLAPRGRLVAVLRLHRLRRGVVGAVGAEP